MPTLNEYADDPGYFIRARPSSVKSPITYQIEPEGYCIIDSYGLSDQDQISWSFIQSLRSLGLLYTDQSGVIGSDEFEPDPKQLKKTKLGKQAAYRLAEVIYENLDINSEELKEILHILGIDPKKFKRSDDKNKNSSNSLTGKTTSTMAEFPVHDSIDVLSGETIYKTNDWWKAAILSNGYQGPEISVYLWQKNGTSWKRKQKYKVKSEKDWNKEKEIIDGLISNNS